ncbi:MAG TPA: conjugal transfer protein TraF [Longimicrobiaceae bacterium]
MSRLAGMGARWVVLALAFAASPLSAQLPNPAAGVLGMGGNQTAGVRGFSALSINPAGLGMPDGPSVSGSVATVRGSAGLGPIGLGDLADYDDSEVPHEVRERWLERIDRANGERGWAGGELTYLSVQMGGLAFQLSTTADIVADLGPGAAELLLFGNAGRTGEPAEIELTGSSLDVVAASTAALGYGRALVETEERAVAVGATLKYTVGHAMMTAMDLGGAASADPVQVAVEFPVVQSDENLGLGDGDRGSGVGLDAGVAWREGRFQAGLSVQNLFNTFSWDEDKLLFRPGTISLTSEERRTDFRARAYAEAPERVRARVRELGYSPVVAAGVGYEVGPQLYVSADVRQQVGDDRSPSPNTHVGAGAEYRPLPWLPVRGGAAAISDGYLFSGGLGLDLTLLQLDAAFARRRTHLGMASQVMVSLSLVLR